MTDKEKLEKMYPSHERKGWTEGSAKPEQGSAQGFYETDAQYRERMSLEKLYPSHKRKKGWS